MRPELVGSFPTADVELDPPLPEVALIGRSNVGKSSLLNALVGQRIAKVSASPGKTRALNVYLIPMVRGAWGVVRGRRRCEPATPSSPEPTTHHSPRTPLTTHHVPRTAFYFLDLPGYGYARASKQERAGFRRLLNRALLRARVAGVIWLLDVRRDPSPDDRAMQEMLAAPETRVLAAVTKSDKLPRGERLRREREIQAALGLATDQVILTSARTGEGVAELREAIEALVREA
jgi:GTP-binding protein